jgi:ribosomal protein S18 acetylase RimI-like enzyme
MELRLAEKKDLKAVYALFLRTRSAMEKEKNFTWSDHYPLKRNFTSDIKDGRAYVHEENGEIIAYIAVSFDVLEDFFSDSKSLQKASQLRKDLQMKDDEDFLLLHRLMVDPSYQGQGRAAKIFADQAALYPGRMVMFAVYPNNRKALRAYDRYGFQNAGIYSAFEYGDHPCYLYFKRYA